MEAEVNLGDGFLTFDVAQSRWGYCMCPNDDSQSRQGCCMCPEIVRVREGNLMLLRADGVAI